MCCFWRETKTCGRREVVAGFKTTRSGAKVSTCGSNFFTGLIESLIIS